MLDGRYGPVYGAPRYWAPCAKCGEEKLKRDMTTLLVKTGVYGTPKKLCCICDSCLPVLLDELEVSMPE